MAAPKRKSAKGKPQRPPFEFNPERIEILKNLAARSLTGPEIASIFSINERTLRRALKKSPEADAAYDRARGRPEFNFDENNIEQLIGASLIQCTQADAATIFGVAEKTFGEALARSPMAQEAWEMGRGKGRTSVRRAQFQMALTNVSMNIFWAKNYLGMQSEPAGEAIEAKDYGEAVIAALSKMEALTLGGS